MALHLEKIGISNARRFGKDIELEFGKGASIILAPNGTGKTTVFEAIEFALTGVIKRLDHPPLCFLRDQQNGMDVSLEFSEQKRCSVSYTKGNEPQLSGDHNFIIQNRSAPEVLSLLRLTHLLEQRSGNWFVQKKGTQAGDLLDNLAIGKDLSGIISSKRSTLKAATSTIGMKRSELENVEKDIDSIKGKIKKRDEIKVESRLKPLEEIYDVLRPIHDRYSNESIELEKVTSDSVNSLLKQTQDLLSTSAENYIKELLKLSRLDNKVNDFQEVTIRIEELGMQVQNSQNEIEENQKLSDEFFQKIEDQKSAIKKDEERLSELIKLQGQIGDLDVKQNKIDELTRSLLDHKNKLSETRGNKETVAKNIDLTKSLFGKFKALNTKEESLRKELRDLDESKKLIDIWKKHLQDRSDISAKNADIKLTYQENQKKLEAEQKKLLELEQEYTKKEKNLNSLRKAFSSIQEAVGIIAENIDQNESECPVCEARYPEGELLPRINNALERIDPSIQEETTNLKILEKNVKDQSDLVGAEKERINKILESINSNEEELKQIEGEIKDQILSGLPYKSPDEASIALNRKEEVLNEDLSTISEDRVKLGQEPDSSELDELNRQMAELGIQEERLDSEIEELTSKISRLKEETDDLKETIGTQNKESIEKQVGILKSLLEEKRRQLKNLENEKEELSTKLDQLRLNLNQNKKELSTFESTKNEIITQWKETQLTGNPDLQTLENKKNEIGSKEKSVKAELEETKKLAEEVSKWKAAEKYEELNSEIKELISDNDEKDYLKHLSKKVKNLKAEVQFMDTRKGVLDNLYSNLDEEKKRLEEYTQAINPLWVSLLKRVVLNPRFARTTLRSYSKQNKKHANTILDLHGEEMQVMDIASEAQITDLQLTFMLAMASTYNWTPWKCLLLDDPTQHHDLVHASSVFDLLREYIIEQDFQIILGTHDTLQARFFKRKLQNDGIPAKIWKLVADEGGVRANLVDY